MSDHDNNDSFSKALRLKEKGNAEFKKGLLLENHTAGKDAITQAGAYYAQALQAQQESTNNEEEEQEVAARNSDILKKDLMLNLAAVGLKLNTYDQVINCCTEVLDNIDPVSGKAYYRRALASIGKKNLQSGMSDLQSALVYNPSDKAIKRAIAKLKQDMEANAHREALRKETEEGRRAKKMLRQVIKTL